MFTEDTVIILGAGASWHYGYPTGEELIEDIIRDIRSDKKNIFQDKRFINLADGLEKFSPLVIDYFLGQFPEHADAGKKMIAYELLKCEGEVGKNHGHRNNEEEISHKTTPNNKGYLNDFKKGKFDDGNWYKYLVDAMVSGAGNGAALLNTESSLDIITFNYDLSLEYYLFERIANISAFLEGDNNFGREFLDKKLQIHHVYGSLYDYKKLCVEGKGWCYGAGEKAKNGGLFGNAMQFSSNLEVIGPDKNVPSRAAIRAVIRKAKNIFILGFGFDKQNCDLLFKEDGEHIFANRTDDQVNIYYTNMNNSLRLNAAYLDCFYKRGSNFDPLEKQNELHLGAKVGGRTMFGERNKGVVTTKSTRSVYDALKYDFSFI